MTHENNTRGPGRTRPQEFFCVMSMLTFCVLHNGGLRLSVVAYIYNRTICLKSHTIPSSNALNARRCLQESEVREIVSWLLRA